MVELLVGKGANVNARVKATKEYKKQVNNKSKRPIYSWMYRCREHTHTRARVLTLYVLKKKKPKKKNNRWQRA